MTQPPAVPLPGDHEAIEGPMLRLRPVTDDDLGDLLRWVSDPGVVEFYGDPPGSVEETRAQYLEANVNPVWRFVIEQGGRGIGKIQYWHQYPGSDYAWSAGIDIFIGEPDARDSGLGTEAVRTMLGYLFDQRGVHRVTVDPEVANARAIRVYEKAGFRLDGVLRHNAFEHGEYVDTHFMSVLEDEWPAARQRWERE